MLSAAEKRAKMNQATDRAERRADHAAARPGEARNPLRLLKAFAHPLRSA